MHNYPTPFVQRDLALLREQYAVREWYQRTRFVNLPALARAVRESDLVFGWFASWHTLFPTLFANDSYPPNTLLIVDSLVKEHFLIEVEAVARV